MADALALIVDSVSSVRARIDAVVLATFADKILIESDIAKRDQMIKQAFEIGIKDYGYIPLHQQPLSWGVSKKVKIWQRADNEVLFYWATKTEE